MCSDHPRSLGAARKRSVSVYHTDGQASNTDNVGCATAILSPPRRRVYAIDRLPR
jgi:hypothetical protein